MEVLYIIVYFICTFGLTELLIYYDGFMHIFQYIRAIAHRIHPHIGELFTCVACCSSWVGILMSTINFFFISTPFTPFNIILGATGLWWLIIPLDMCVTAGMVLMLHHLDEALERMGITYTDEEEQ